MENKDIIKAFQYGVKVLAEELKRISEFSLDKDAFVVTDQEIDSIKDELIKKVEKSYKNDKNDKDDNNG